MTVVCTGIMMSLTHQTSRLCLVVFMSGCLQTHHNTFIVSGGKVTDTTHVYDEQPVVVFDLPRTITDHCDHIYRSIEKFKDGCIF